MVVVVVVKFSSEPDGRMEFPQANSRRDQGGAAREGSGRHTEAHHPLLVGDQTEGIEWHLFLDISFFFFVYFRIQENLGNRMMLMHVA
jgi:hypothetical protein